MSHTSCDIIILGNKEIFRHRKTRCFFIARGKAYGYSILSAVRKKSRKPQRNHKNKLGF